MGLLGAAVEPVEAGARTLKEAVSAAIRDWVTNVADTHYIIGSAVGPAPVPGARPRPPAGDRRRGPRADPRDRGTAARPRHRLRRRRLERDRQLRPVRRRRGVELIGVEAAGEGLNGRHGASLAAGRTGVLHGALSSVLADEDGQILEAHSISAGLDYPGVGPEHAMLRDSGRARYVAITDTEALLALRELVPARGDRAGARELARDRLAARARAASRPAALDVLTLSGRGDKDLAEALAGLERLTRPMAETGVERIAAAFAAGARGRQSGADALSDGRLPRHGDLRSRDRRLRRHRRRPDRARRALLRPARRRPGDPCGGNGGARPPAPASRASWSSASASPAASRCCRWSTRTSSSTLGAERFAAALADRRRGRRDHPRPAARRGPLGRRGAARARPCADRIRLADDLARAAPPRSPPRAVGFTYVVSLAGVTGERADLPPELGEMVAAVKRRVRRPGRGRVRHRHARAGSGRSATIADGVIIGTRLVRAVADAADAGAAVDAVSGFMADTRTAL